MIPYSLLEGSLIRLLAAVGLVLSLAGAGLASWLMRLA